MFRFSFIQILKNILNFIQNYHYKDKSISINNPNFKYA
jgi:hypothetical protein